MSPFRRQAVTRTLAAACLLTLAGCQSAYRGFERRLTAAVAAGDYDAAADMAAARAEKSTGNEISRVVYNLEAARTAQMAGRPDESRDFYGRVHDELRPYLDEKAEAKVTEAVATTAVNQAVATYRATPVERVMAATLDAANALALGDHAEARVLLNLARDWQDDAVRRAGVTEAEPGPQVRSVLADRYANLADRRAYADFRNPFTSHLRGVFLLETGVGPGDLDRARFELRDAVAMEPGLADLVAPDLDRIDAGAPPDPTTWIYFLAGLAPRLEEIRVDLPVPSSSVPYVAAAFPALRFRTDYPGRLDLAGAPASAGTALLADVESMVAADFRDRLPTIVAQEIASSALKATATYAADDEGGSLAQLVGILYQAVTTAADLRSWRTLPARVLLARMPTPADGLIAARAGGVATEIRVQPGASHIVFMTLPSSAAHRASVVTASLSPRTREEPSDAN